MQASFRDWHAFCNPQLCRRDARSHYKEIDMNKLTIKDLAIAKELDREQMRNTQGGMGRTPQQILAWELTGKPATWQGLVLDEDNRLHVPAL
jgi:hypothetical protein